MSLEKINKKLGFGMMRLPTKAMLIDNGEICKMVDAFMEAGFNYFDTAHIYMAFRSETATRKALVERYDRESFLLADKLTYPLFRKQSQIRPFFEKQLKACGVDYFDVYLMHAQNRKNFEKFKSCKAYEIAFELKKEGKIKHVGISFHDKADVLDRILTEYPQIEVVQIQFNYADYDDPSVESRKCYDVCRKHNKPIIVMEPVKGGSLVNLPEKAQKIFDDLGGCSNAGYAIRFAASFEGVIMVLSGMGNIEMMNDNISFMKDFKPLTEEEFDAVYKVRDIFRGLEIIPCTACKYCVDTCPKSIPIPDVFAGMNAKKQSDEKSVDQAVIARASDCIQCGKCEELCPQHLNIRELLKDATK